VHIPVNDHRAELTVMQLDWSRTRRDPLLMALGRRVRELREKEGWTQETLAERTDLDRSYIAGIEAGLRNPSLKALGKLAKGFRLSLAEFLKGVG
jgi:DNA-binding XRE family transcriptional regulator